MWFDQLTFRSKLSLNFLVGSGSLVAALLFCIIQIGSIKVPLSLLAENSVESLRSASQISQLRLRYRIRSLEFMLAESEADRNKLAASMRDLDDKLKQELEAQSKLIDDEADKSLVATITTAAKAYRESVEKAASLMQAGNRDQALAIQKAEWLNLANTVRDATDALEKHKQDEANERAGLVLAGVNIARVGAWIALFVSTVAAVAFSLWFAGQITKRLNAAVNVTRRIAEGELSVEMPPTSTDEIGKLTEEIRHMRDSLRSSVTETRKQATEVADASRLLSSKVREMGHSMEHKSNSQSSAASAIASNIEALTVSITRVSNNTNEASELATHADRKATNGAETISRVVEEIQCLSQVVTAAATRIAALEDQSTRISNIIVVIREIADQTNLLALNAAIEAARAGEQGRGFAVVADEVRKLAERTSQSTSEISQMITSIQHSTREAVTEIKQGVSSVDQGVELANAAGKAVEELRGIARQVADRVSEIATGLREQSAAATDVGTKVDQIVAHAEEVSANTSSISDAAHGLNGIANSMQATIHRFKV